MKHFLFNLTKSTAKATQNAGGGASRKLMRHEDARGLAQSDNRYCIGNASDLSPRLVRLDSLSILSRQSDLRTYVGRIAAIIVLVLTVGIGQVWGTPTGVDAYYKCTKPSSTVISSVTPTTGDGTYFSAFSAPTNTAGDLAQNSDTLRLNVPASTEATLSFTYTAKQAISISSFRIYATTSSDKIKNANISYTGNNTGVAKTFSKGAKSLTTSYIEVEPASDIEIAKDGTFTININLSNTDGSNARNLRMYRITLYVSADGGGGGGATTYDVNMAAMSNGSVTASPTSQEEGEDVTLTVSPSTGYELSGDITVTGEESGDEITATDNGDGTWTFEMPAEDVTVGASFSAIDYDVTYSAPTNGDYTISVAGGSATSASKTANYGQTITLVASPSSGYVLSSWTVTKDGGGTVSVSNNQFTMPADGVTITATFEESSCPSSGTIFSMTMLSKVTGSDKSLTASETVDLGSDSYATVSDGTATFSNTGSAKGKITKDSPNKLRWDGNAAYLKLDFDCELQTGDSIIISGVSGCEMSFTKTTAYAAADSTSTIDGKHCFIVPAGFNEVSTIYCWRSRSTSLYITGLKVSRPSSGASSYTLTWNFNGGGCSETEGDDYTAGGDVTYGTDIVFPSNLSMSKPGYKFNGWSDGTSTYKEGDTYTVAGDVTLTALWTPFTVPAATGLAVDEDFVVTWNVPGKINLSTASLSNSDPDYFIQYQVPADSKSYDSSTEELTVTYTASAWDQEGIALPFTGNKLETITYEYKGHRVFPAVVKSDGSTLYWEYDVVESSDSWTKVTRTPTTVYSNSGTETPLPTAKAITFCANPNADKTDESFYIRNVFYHLQNQVDVDHVVLMRKEGSAATDTTAGGTAVRLYSGKMSHYADETVVKGKTYYYTVFSVHADGSLSAGTTQSVVVPKDDLDITYAAGTASSVTHNSATLPFTMSATTGVASVTLKVYNTSDVLVKTVADVTAATSGSGNVTGLDPNTTYYFTVTPIGDATHNDGSESTKSSTFTTETCTPHTVSKVTMSAYNSGSKSGYNNDEYAGTPKYNLSSVSGEGSTHKGYKLGSSGHYIYAQLGKGSFEEGDVIKVYVSKPNDAYKVDKVAQTILDLYIHDGSSTHTLLHTVEDVDAEGEYTYTLTASDITTIGAYKYIGVYRPSSGRTQNPYIYSVEIEGCRSWTPSHDVSTVVSGSVGGTVSAAASSVMEGGTTTITATPATGYEVTNWAVSGTGASISPSGASNETEATLTMGTADATVTVTFGLADYSVTYDGNGGSGSAPADANTYNYGGEVTVVSGCGTLTKSGYTFRGWMYDGNFYRAGDKFDMPAEDVTLTAVWESNTGSETVTLTHYGKQYDTGSPRRGYAYVGSTSGTRYIYETNNSNAKNIDNDSSAVRLDYSSAYLKILGSGATTSITDSLFSSVTQVSFKWKLYNSGSSNKTTTVDVYVGSTKVGNAIELTGQNSDGFQTKTISGIESKNGAIKIVNTGTSGTNQNLHLDDIAITCTSVNYDITFADGSIVPASHATWPSDIEGVPSGSKIIAPAAPTAAGYTFAGWYENEACTGDAFDDWSSAVTEDISLYAKWTPVALTYIGSDWNDASDWDPACVPTIEHDVIIPKVCFLKVADAKAKSVTIRNYGDGETEGKLYIYNGGVSSYGGLVVAEGIKAVHSEGGTPEPTTDRDLSIHTDFNGNAGLICGEASSNTQATYVFYSKVYRYGSYYINQYVGIPFASMDPYDWYSLTIFEYDSEKDKWKTPVLDEDGKLKPFTAYNIISKVSGSYMNSYYLYGTLNLPGTSGTKALQCGSRIATEKDPESEGYDAEHPFFDNGGDYMFANSWTAPISIKDMTASDISDLDGDGKSDLVQCIYIFNAGYVPKGDDKKVLGELSGTWSSFPFGASTYMAGAVIPAGQAFLVTSKVANATLTLDYGRHVYTPALAAGLNTSPLRAPRRNVSTEDPNVLRIKVVRDSIVAEQLYILEREDFTFGYDDGWDGNKIMGLTSSPQLYAQTGTEKMAVSAVPDVDGIELGFKAGTDTNAYYFSFEYNDSEPLYLYDRETQIFTRISNEASYEFLTNDTDEHARFVITRSNAPMIETGVGDVKDDVNRAEKFFENNMLFIRRGEKVYNVDGSLVK